MWGCHLCYNLQNIFLHSRTCYVFFPVPVHPFWIRIRIRTFYEPTISKNTRWTLRTRPWPFWNTSVFFPYSVPQNEFSSVPVLFTNSVPGVRVRKKYGSVYAVRGMIRTQFHPFSCEIVRFFFLWLEGVLVFFFFFFKNCKDNKLCSLLYYLYSYIFTCFP